MYRVKFILPNTCIRLREQENVFEHFIAPLDKIFIKELGLKYRSGPVNSKSFVGKVFLRIKWIFGLRNHL